MLKKILGTIGTRYLVALLNLALIFINAKALGAAGVGLVGLIVASVNIAVIFSSILCGNTIVYFMNRYPMAAIVLPAYGWAFAGSAVATAGMYLTGLLPAGYGVDVYLLGTLNSLVAVNARLLLSKDRIAGFNLTFILQGGLLFFTLLYFYYVAGREEVQSYVRGAYITNGIAFAVSTFLLLPYFKEAWKKREKPTEVPLFAILREMFVYGLWSGADNLAEVCTTRLNYFLIQRFAGLGSVGLLDAGTKVSESVWHISRSVSFIEYSSVAKTPSRAEQKRITLQLFKLTGCAMTVVMGMILLIPERVYTDYLFSPEFSGMRSIIAGLSVGVVALGCNSILSHYFIGTGKVRYSTASSCVGLLTLVAAGYLLIPAYGVVGSAFSTSIAFGAMLLFSLTVFIRQTKSRLIDFLPGRADWEYFLSAFRRVFSGKKRPRAENEK